MLKQFWLIPVTLPVMGVSHIQPERIISGSDVSIMWFIAHA